MSQYKNGAHPAKKTIARAWRPRNRRRAGGCVYDRVVSLQQRVSSVLTSFVPAVILRSRIAKVESRPYAQLGLARFACRR